jgi:hypothetical protein
MKIRHSLAALSLALLAGTAFAASPAAPAASTAAAAKTTAPAKGKALHCKKGETNVKGKCEKSAKPQG